MRRGKGSKHWSDREAGKADCGEQHARGEAAPARKPHHDIRQPAAVNDPHAKPDEQSIDRVERKPAASGEEGGNQKAAARH